MVNKRKVVVIGMIAATFLLRREKWQIDFVNCADLFAK